MEMHVLKNCFRLRKGQSFTSVVKLYAVSGLDGVYDLCVVQEVVYAGEVENVQIAQFGIVKGAQVVGFVESLFSSFSLKPRFEANMNVAEGNTSYCQP